MPGFDASKDKTLYAERVDVGDGAFIEVKLASYNNGPPKLQLSRLVVAEGTESFRRWGRMTLEEATRVAAAIPEIISRGTAAIAKEGESEASS